MNQSEDLQKFFEFCRMIGSMTDHVQGGGGNCSYKDNEKMYIKASGTMMSLVDHNNMAIVNFKKVLKALARHSNPDNFDKEVSSLKQNENKPSIETGFHALLDKYVIHSHSVYVNTVACSKDFQGIINNLSIPIIWVEYSAPGIDLCKSISKSLSDIRKSLIIKPKIIFLQNHGLIVSSNSIDELIYSYSLVHEEIKRLVHFPNFSSILPPKEINPLTDKSKTLFPDQIVYKSIDNFESPAFIDTAKAYIYLNQTMGMNGLDPNFLSCDDVSRVDQLESEKYRKNLIK